MSRFLSRTLLAIFALSFAPHVAIAQGDTTSLSGTVISAETGAPLPYAVVTIASAGAERFANQRGQFTIPKLAVGKYRLHVRQLGYTPSDVEVTLPATGLRDVTVKLSRLAYRMTEMLVSSDWTCDEPGRPTGSAQAMQIFAQIEQNADRLRLMSEQYPFELRGERWSFVRRNDGDVTELKVDTAVMENGKRIKYRPGSLVYTTGTSNANKQYFLLLPTLADFADVDFQNAHCFLVRGVDTASDKHQLRVDFKVSSKLKKPDVEGSVFLDTATFQIRSAEIRLTTIPSEIKGVLAVRISTVFREVRPGLPVLDGVHVETDFAPSKGRATTFQGIEDQKPLGLKFLKQAPDSVPRENP